MMLKSGKDYEAASTCSGLSLEQMTVKVTMSEKSMVTISYFSHTSMFVFPLANSYDMAAWWIETETRGRSVEVVNHIIMTKRISMQIHR